MTVDNRLERCIRVDGFEARVYKDKTIVYVDQLGKEIKPFDTIKSLHKLVEKALKSIGKELDV